MNRADHAGSHVLDRVLVLEMVRVTEAAAIAASRLIGRGDEHDRWLGELRVLDSRMRLVSWAISLSVLSAVLICAVVVLLFSASLTRLHFATAIALLFIGSMVAIGLGFAIFLIETRVGSRAVRVRSELLQHTVDEGT